MKISCLNTTVLKANRTKESKNNDPTIRNLPLPIKVKHVPKKVKKSMIPSEGCKYPKVLNNAMRIDELMKAKAAKTEKASEIEEKPKKRGHPCKKKRYAKEKAGEFEDASDQDEETLDTKVKKPRKILVKLRNACPEREQQDVLDTK